MIPSGHSYYHRRAREHRALAQVAAGAEERAMHSRLVEAYEALARSHRPRKLLHLKLPA